MSAPNKVRGVTFGEGDVDTKLPDALGGVNNTKVGLVGLEGTDETFVRTLASTFPWVDAVNPDPVASSASTGGIDKVARRDHRHTAGDDISIQSIEVSLNGVLVGARKRLNFKESGLITISAVDNNPGNSIDITISK